MPRTPGLTARAKLALSYAAFLMVAGGLLLAVVWVFLLRYVPTNSRSSPQPMLGPDRGDLVRAFVPPAAWALLFLLILGLVGGWLLAGWMLAPLSRITNATRRAATGSLSHRIDLEGRHDEFRELADSFDAMLARLEAVDSEQRRFAASASHELRTPLAITQALLDVARNDPAPDVAVLIDRLHAVNSRAIDLTEALLLLTRSEKRSFRRDRVDLSLAVEDAVETLLPLAEARGITIVTDGSAATVIGSESLLLQMTTNLLHNAIVHNLPEHGTIRLSTDSDSTSATFSIENTGPTIAPQTLATLTEPFQRGAGRIRTDDAGVGLGLAIVKSIVEAHDGVLSLSPGTAGGLWVTVRLRAAPPQPGL
jgi:two-component system sensor histidine kinase VanS